MNKHIGIVTLQRSLVNYGAALQGYALWCYIKALGYDCEVVDILRPCHSQYKYSPEFGEREPSLKSKLSKFISYNIGKKRVFKKRESMFSAFHNLLDYSRQYRSLDELYNTPPVYDVCVTGSDQVWNPNMPFYNGVYFWDFINNNSKKISYASSFSIDSLPKGCEADYTKWLNEYDLLSVREKSGISIVKALTGKECVVVLDPVFLLSKEEWNEIETKVENIPSDYVFLYLVKYDANMMNHAKRFASDNHLPLYVVLSSQKVIPDQEVHQLIDVGPKEWLYLMNHANYVLTDSFHGTSFSIIMHKPFVTFVNPAKNTNSRINTILGSLGLESKAITLSRATSLKLEQFLYDIDQVKVELDKLIEASKSFLKAGLD